jgi:hypothetical protein
MKRIIPTTALLSILLVATVASAQFRDDTVLLTFDVGTVLATSEYSDADVTGNVAGFTLEKVLGGGKFNAGFSVIWLKGDETVKSQDGTEEKITYTSVPFFLTGRWNFLNSSFAANIGLGIGIHSSTRKLHEGTTEELDSTTIGTALSIPIEVAYFVDPDFYLQAVYTPSWMDGTPLRDDIAHSFALGLGFVWGGEQDTSDK